MVFADDSNGRCQKLHFDSLCFRFFNLFRRRGHFSAGSSIKDKHFLRAHPDGRSYGIHGYVAAAQHGDAVTQVNLLSEVNSFEIIDTVDDPFEIFSLYI